MSASRHLPISPPVLAATRLRVALWCLTLPLPEGEAGDRLAAVQRVLPRWVGAGCSGRAPTGLAPLLAERAGIARSFASQILRGDRPFPAGSDWAQKLFS